MRATITDLDQARTQRVCQRIAVAALYGDRAGVRRLMRATIAEEMARTITRKLREMETREEMR